MELIRQKFFGEILSFFMYFCYLKNCTCFFGKPYNGCLCACCRIAKSLVIFAREFNSLVKYCIIFYITCQLYFFKLFFQSKNIISWYFSLCLLCNLKNCLFQCVVSNVYCGDHMLIFRVFHEREILYQIVYGLGVSQVRLGVLSLEKLENLQVFCLCLNLL